MKIQFEELVFLELPKEDDLYKIYQKDPAFTLLSQSAQGCIFKRIVKEWKDE